MREIADKAGVGIGTLYRHFPQRADLVAAVFRHEIDACADEAVILAADSTLEIGPEMLGAPSDRPSPAPQATSLEAVERAHIASVLEQTNWVIDGPRGAAKILDLHPNTLRSRMKKLGITRVTHELS